jgi:hypothetical protein
MSEILLVFVITGFQPTISDRVFESYDECKEFVNTLVKQSVVNSDYGFQFLSVDGLLVSGQCVAKEDYQK